MVTIICLIRHGQTDWNKQGLVQGITNKRLNEVGIKQANDAADFLLENDPTWDVILSSPLSRAYDTAVIIAKKLHFTQEIKTDPIFMERQFGAAEGKVLDKTLYEEIFQEKTEGLESLTDLQKRGLSALSKVNKAYPGKKVIITTHSQFIKGILSALDPDFDFTMYLKNSSLNYFTITNGQIKIWQYNITK
ncbi:MAG TPA: histidine phosphatase family protein [Bacilli bacterium]|nr:histidine phosphatase family protein [Bacilli bacterium]